MSYEIKCRLRFEHRKARGQIITGGGGRSRATLQSGAPHMMLHRLWWQKWHYYVCQNVNSNISATHSSVLIYICFSTVSLKTNYFWLRRLSNSMSVSLWVSSRSIAYPPQASDPLSGHPGHLCVFPENVRVSANPNLALHLKKLLSRNFAKSSLPKNSFRRTGKLLSRGLGTIALTTKRCFVSCGQENLTYLKPS